MDTSKIKSLLGDKAEYLLGHTCKTIDKSLIHIPSPSTVDDIWINTDRNIQTLNNLQRMLGSGRLANTLFVYPSRRSGYRTYGRRFIRPQPYLLRPGKHCKAGYRRRL